MESTTEIIRSYLEERFLFEFDEEITPDTDLFKAGVIDSFGYVRMMKFLESEFAVTIDSDEILMDVLVSLTAIDVFIQKKLAEI
ncbi:phosphopantetheine-binding protein [Kitasatospora brasiliensis]|uniref:phosphopantetheine-binding protein n=1 Tax=Kitasatospora brasiliensis TaxID=3058040 RepID=UPI002930FC47|nr:phosphopantetheine-binding protein [Kitasatospora sp. K002]